MNILFITLGSSEIQLNTGAFGNDALMKEGNNLYVDVADIPRVRVRKNRNHEGFYLPVDSRAFGKRLRRDNMIESYISRPLIDPLIERFKKESINFERIFLIATDQDDPKFRNTDTITYAHYFKDYFRRQDFGKTVEILAIKDGVKDIDKQYDYFSRLSNDLAQDANIEKVFLYAQGGIDQINHALTLQLLQAFKNKVVIYQKAEHDEVNELEFPQLFLRDLTKQKVLKHLEDFDFDKAGELMLGSPSDKELSEFAFNRLQLKHHNLDQSSIPEKWRFRHTGDKIKLNGIKLKDLICAFRIDIRQKKFNDALTKLYTIYENLFKQRIDELTDRDTSQYYKKKYGPGEINKAWVVFLKESFGDDIINRLLSKRQKPHLNNPNVICYFYLIRMCVKKGRISDISEEEIKKIDGILNDLRTLRNSINHNMGSADENEILEILKKGKRKSDFEGLVNLIDKFSGGSTWSIFEEIKNFLLDRYKGGPDITENTL